VLLSLGLSEHIPAADSGFNNTTSTSVDSIIRSTVLKSTSFQIISQKHRLCQDAMDVLTFDEHGEPRLKRSYNLRFVGDWGGANFHRICAWLTQEFCDRAGPGSRTSILSFRDGGMEGLTQVHEGGVDLAIGTPASLKCKALTGEAPFKCEMPNLRTIGRLPQNDRMVLAVDPKYDIKSIENLQRVKPAFRLATSTDDGTNFIGHVATEFLNTHGISKETIESWGGRVLTRHRPERCAALVESG
jgi:hypothetical protein